MGSGKSTVVGWFRDWGGSVIDGDVLGWGVLKEPAVVASIEAEFGRGVLTADGSVDRASLGRVVFADAGAMARLNAIVQPRLLDCVREALEHPRVGGKPV